MKRKAFITIKGTQHYGADKEKIIKGIESGANRKHRKRHDHARNLKGK